MGFGGCSSLGFKIPDMYRRFIGLVLVFVGVQCAPQPSGDLVHIPEPAEYMRGYFPLEVVFDERQTNEMVILLSSGRLKEVRLLAISMPVGQKLWEYSFGDRIVRDIHPDPDGGVWVFVEGYKRRGRVILKDFQLVKVKNGEKVAAVDLPDTMYTDWYSFVLEGNDFVGKPVSPPLKFTVCDRTGNIKRAFPPFRTLKEFYEAFKKVAGNPNFRKFVLTLPGDRVVVISEALDSLWMYDLNSGELVEGVRLGEPQMVPRGGGRAVIMNRIMAVGKAAGDTFWVLTLKDIRFFKGVKPVYRVDFGDKRFLAGAVKGDTFYWITYDKSVRFSPINRYRIVEVEQKAE